MTPTEQILVSVPMAAALGLVFGLSACTLSCLSYLGPVFLANGGGIRQSWRTLVPFSLGRLTGYAALGTIAGAAGQYIGGELEGGRFRWLLGVAAVLVGTALLLRRRRPACGVDRPKEVPLTRRDALSRTVMPGGLFLMGTGMALTPCTPLGTVLFSAATIGDAGHGLSLGLGFGLGAIAIPSLVYGVGAAYLGERLREQLRQWRGAERIGALMLILVGASNVMR